MPKRLRNRQFRLFVLGLVLATFLPMASATVACEIACLLGMHSVSEAASLAGTGSAATHAGHATEHDVRVAHFGPCHLASMPTVCGNVDTSPVNSSQLAIKPGASLLPASYVGPPPKHKPRI